MILFHKSDSYLSKKKKNNKSNYTTNFTIFFTTAKIVVSCGWYIIRVVVGCGWYIIKFDVSRKYQWKCVPLITIYNHNKL